MCSVSVTTFEIPKDLRAGNDSDKEKVHVRSAVCTRVAVPVFSFTHEDFMAMCRQDESELSAEEGKHDTIGSEVRVEGVGGGAGRGLDDSAEDALVSG